MKDLLEVNGLSLSFDRGETEKKTINHISFSMKEGEILGVVGESGSGKTMTALAIMGLLPEGAEVSGSVHFQGREIIGLSDRERSKIQGKDMAMVFQEPMTSLNPVMKVGFQVGEGLMLHTDLKAEEIRTRTLKALEEAGLENPEKIYDAYPHELSGGMRQRAMIAMAMIHSPALLIADEPTTALDVLVQAQILELLKELNQKKKISVLFISHNLNVIRRICDRVLVMRQGEIVEQGTVHKIFYNMENDYTRQLVESAVTGNQDCSGAGTVLSIEDLSVFYRQRGLSLRARRPIHPVLEHISFQVMEGEIFGIVGESGCGKSTLARVITGIHRDYTGQMRIEGNIRPQMVFQDPFGSLNPARKIGWIMEEPLRVRGISDKEKRKRLVQEMLEDIGLNETCLDRYPRELSGGQRQRISIGLALLMESKLLIADEPVSALDVTIQKQILELLMKINREKGTAIIVITHDLNLVHQICHRAAVIHDGTIVEMAEGRTLCEHPRNEYTRRLLEAAMRGGEKSGSLEKSEKGSH